MAHGKPPKPKKPVQVDAAPARALLNAEPNLLWTGIKLPDFHKVYAVFTSF